MAKAKYRKRSRPPNSPSNRLTKLPPTVTVHVKGTEHRIPWRDAANINDARLLDELKGSVRMFAELGILHAEAMYASEMATEARKTAYSEEFEKVKEDGATDKGAEASARASDAYLEANAKELSARRSENVLAILKEAMRLKVQTLRTLLYETDE